MHDGRWAPHHQIACVFGMAAAILAGVCIWKFAGGQGSGQTLSVLLLVAIFWFFLKLFDKIQHNARIDAPLETLSRLPNAIMQSKMPATRDVTSSELNLEAASSHRAASDYTHVIALVHGIRDIGAWQDTVSAELAEEGTHVAVVRFAYHPAPRFLFPFDLSGGPVRELVKNLQNLRAEFKNARMSVIAHSFGTFVVQRALRADHNIVLWKLVFCGSVADDLFDWSEFRHRIGDGVRPTKDFIVNDCGTGDYWPVLGAAFGWRYGMAGALGFSEAQVTNRFFRASDGKSAGGHSLYFDNDFVRAYWRPFLIDDEKPPRGNGKQGQHLGWWATIFYSPYIRMMARVFALILWISLVAVPVLAVLAVIVNRVSLPPSVQMQVPHTQKQTLPAQTKSRIANGLELVDVFLREESNTRSSPKRATVFSVAIRNVGSEIHVIKRARLKIQERWEVIPLYVAEWNNEATPVAGTYDFRLIDQVPCIVSADLSHSIDPNDAERIEFKQAQPGHNFREREYIYRATLSLVFDANDSEIESGEFIFMTQSGEYEETIYESKYLSKQNIYNKTTQAANHASNLRVAKVVKAHGCDISPVVLRLLKEIES